MQFVTYQDKSLFHELKLDLGYFIQFSYNFLWNNIFVIKQGFILTCLFLKSIKACLKRTSKEHRQRYFNLRNLRKESGTIWAKKKKRFKKTVKEN